jgi:hypothetical protein
MKAACQDAWQRRGIDGIFEANTDGVVQLGKMYGTTTGFYLLAGPG